MNSKIFTDAQPNPDVPEVQDVSVEDVQANLGKMKLVDVRQPAEFTGELGHIHGAELIPLDQLEAQVNKLPKNEEIVFICRSGKRSVAASMIAMQNGYDTVYNMVGGMIRWNDVGFETE